MLIDEQKERKTEAVVDGQHRGRLGRGDYQTRRLGCDVDCTQKVGEDSAEETSYVAW